MTERGEHQQTHETLHESLVLIAGNSNRDLSLSIGKILGLEVQFPVGNFADGESNVQIPKNLRNRDVVVIQSTSNPQEKNIVDMQLIADAAVRASGRRITAVIPYFGYARQDRKSQPREPISASVIIRTLGLFYNQIITVDLHSHPITGVFAGPWDNLSALPILRDALSQDVGLDSIVVSPDTGGIPRAESFSRILGLQNTQPLSVYKSRDHTIKGVSQSLGLMGDVEGKECVLIDDMIDTAGSIVKASKLLVEKGARRVIVAATHGLFSNNAISLIEESPIEQVVVTDSIAPTPDVLKSPKIKIVSVAPILATAIRHNQTGESLSEDPTLFPK